MMVLITNFKGPLIFNYTLSSRALRDMIHLLPFLQLCWVNGCNLHAKFNVTTFRVS